MSDRQTAFLTVLGYFSFWIFTAIHYFIIVGIMGLIEMVISTGANIWLVGLIVLMFIYVSAVGKKVTKSAIKKMDDEE